MEQRYKLSEDDYQMIGRYLDDTMGHREKLMFSGRIDSDPVLRAGYSELAEIWDAAPKAAEYFKVDHESAFKRLEARISPDNLSR